MDYDFPDRRILRKVEIALTYGSRNPYRFEMEGIYVGGRYPFTEDIYRRGKRYQL